MLYFKTTKTVIKLKNNVSKLLKGLSTNTSDASKNAFLDVFGKIIITSYQIKVDEDILLIIEKQFVERFKQHIEKYRKLTKTIVEETDYQVYANITDEKIDEKEDYKKEDGDDEFVIKEKTGAWLVTKKILTTKVSENDFKVWRVNNKLALQGVDYDREMILNIDDEEYVSFTKGCYLGQEIVARVHNLGKPPKKLVVKSEDDCTEEEKNRLTSKGIDQKTGKILGFIFVKNEEE
ncbi:tRNA-modifying protein YgfZ [Candidatus Woesearchaeota archaeon]|nr:tRNA-modifying protein YgfZ [Candidatus Woesearchaeota archaeon]